MGIRDAVRRVKAALSSAPDKGVVANDNEEKSAAA
jgi:hypothetical protein